MGSIWVRPLNVLMNTGKNTTIVTTSRRGMLLVVEKMLLNIGARAMIGMALMAAASGVTISLNARNRLARNAMATPATVPQIRPTSALVPVLRAALMISEWLRSIWCQMSDGLGRRNGLMSRTMTNHCHRARNAMPNRIGGTITSSRRCQLIDPRCPARRRGRRPAARSPAAPHAPR